jgi:surface protein
MKQLFCCNTEFNQPLINWNISNVTNLDSLFFCCSKFNQPLSTSDNIWNTSNVLDMSCLFYGTNYNLSIENWNISNVSNMRGMFDSSTYNQPLNSWDTTNVKNMDSMFRANKVFNQSLDKWNTSNVINMSFMFFDCTSFNSPINNWDISNVKDFCWFLKSSAFNQPLDNWKINDYCNNHNMFSDADKFNQDLSNWLLILRDYNIGDYKFPDNYKPKYKKYWIKWHHLNKNIFPDKYIMSENSCNLCKKYIRNKSDWICCNCNGLELHKFHIKCIETWSKNNKYCPVCNKVFPYTINSFLGTHSLAV